MTIWKEERNKSRISAVRTAASWLGSAALVAALLTGCTSNSTGENNQSLNEVKEEISKIEPPSDAAPVDTQPSAVYYEIFVRSFYDSDGDGIGDFKGLTAKLDYLNDGNPDTNEDLGIGGIWLMPINPSPSYHGYDVTDYRAINPEYGTMEDFEKFLEEAHKRGIKVVMDLIVNHSSKEHPWFIEAAKDPNSKYRDWYVWAEDNGIEPTGVAAASNGDAWHTARGDHYLATFWEGMPDLNLDNPEVRKEMNDIGHFWLDKGLDGFRLDAAKHIYENLVTDKSQATTDKNVAWWQEFRQSQLSKKPDAYLVGEIWDPSPTVIANYLNNALDSGFNFGLSETIISIVNNEKDSNLGFTLERTYGLFADKSAGKFIDAPFLSNHDINRTMSQVNENVDHAKMAASILLTLPGNPFLYYGEEIGMLGAKPDEQIREPMLWYKGGIGTGQTTWEPLIRNENAEGISVEEQTSDPESILSHYRKMISLRNSLPALKDGGIKEYSTDNDGVTTFVRLTAEQKVLVAHNLTGETQIIDLAENADEHQFKAVLNQSGEGAVLDGTKLSIPPYSTVIVE